MSKIIANKPILIADDQAFLRSLLVSMLRTLGHRTQEAADGVQALQQLSIRLHAAILDHRMAGHTGLEVLQAIRCGQTRAQRDLPVILVTGHADEHIVRVAGQLDVSALLSKPISSAQLQARLDAIEKTAIQLKPESFYAAVNVDPAECEAAARQSSSAWVLGNGLPPGEAPFVTAAQLAQRKSAQRGTTMLGGDIHYSRLRPGMVLTRDLHTANGKLLLAAGTEINQAMAKRLLEICEHNPNMTFLSVAPAKRKLRQTAE